MYLYQLTSVPNLLETRGVFQGGGYLKIIKLFVFIFSGQVFLKKVIVNEFFLGKSFVDNAKKNKV